VTGPYNDPYNPSSPDRRTPEERAAYVARLRAERGTCQDCRAPTTGTICSSCIRARSSIARAEERAAQKAREAEFDRVLWEDIVPRAWARGVERVQLTYRLLDLLPTMGDEEAAAALGIGSRTIAFLKGSQDVNELYVQKAYAIALQRRSKHPVVVGLRRTVEEISRRHAGASKVAKPTTLGMGNEGAHP
jgi:hypothetical protein